MSRLLTTASSAGSQWQRDLSASADTIARLLATHTDHTDKQEVLWWGGGYSGLCAGVGSDGQSAVLATTDPRQHHNGSAAYARTMHLLRLQDLRADHAGLEAMLSVAMVRDVDGYLALQERLMHQRDSAPAVATGSFDAVVADFVLNRVDAAEVASALAEAQRVLRSSGRMLAVMLVSDESLAANCIVKSAPAGPALRIPTETDAVRAFQEAGFHGITLHWPGSDNPAALDRVGDVDVRMCLIEAHLGKQGPCIELGQAVIYRGPWSEIRDDDGHVYARGVRTAVCGKTYDLLMRPPYAGAFIGLRSVNEPLAQHAAPYDCDTPMLRDPRVTKGLQLFSGAREDSESCAAGSGCC